MQWTFCVCRIAQEEHLQRRQLLETRRMAKCYLNYISNHRDQVQPLFELLTVVSHKTRCDYTFVRDFYVDLVADKYTVEEKKRVSGTALPSCSVLCTSRQPLCANKLQPEIKERLSCLHLNSTRCFCCGPGAEVSCLLPAVLCSSNAVLCCAMLCSTVCAFCLVLLP